ncbi:methionine ABC transporter permease [Basilea psittacipulmonis]|uniref:Methionine ABC transporter ATP-binding protein n=1 Tax=Basilea psittacipulmonis DSM 24701 TaxID=1072685 RepID=A0A077DGS3_9BURK|nr:methionine ABC transporter permease [Basilea psittacipulmonis]AIL33336.1 methionine ABC transporter ATP-binding protein [Basilea psittacipulmonis DSM 24701]
MNDLLTSFYQAFDVIAELKEDILLAFGETCLMVSIATLISVVFGTLMGMALFSWSHPRLAYQPSAYRVLNYIVNVMRALPFLVLTVIVGVPLSMLILGTSIGPLPASIPLGLSGAFFFARLVDNSLRSVSPGIIEAAVAMGAKNSSILFKVLLNEARARIARDITLLVISILSFSATVGIIGGGGLGDFVLRYGYYRYLTEVLVFIIIILIIIVTIIQAVGDFVAKRLDKH